MIAIAGVGLCTAQGTADELVVGGTLATSAPLPWPVSPRARCPIGFAARGLDPALRGAARWHALAEVALGELGGARAPIVIGSCNGGADALDAEDWTRAFAALGLDEPVASAACASGLHALWLGATRIAAGCDELVVLAVDVMSAVNHDQFEGLRVLSEAPTPWQATAAGFVLGEAAVALRLVRARDGDGLPRLAGPALAHDREGSDALAELVDRAAGPAPAWLIGQGGGPVAVDDRELAAFSRWPRTTPLATALAHFGHTLGASSLLSVALAVLGRRHPLRGLARPATVASDGRVLGTAVGDALVACRALGGACAVAGVGAPGTFDDPPVRWSEPEPAPALRMPLLRRIAAEALAHRPASPPGAFVVRLDAPLAPPSDARIGGRLLPSVVLEMTPGFCAQLVARSWGYGGPAVCLVGGTPASWQPTLAACRRVHAGTFVLHVERDGLAWGV